MLRSVKIHGTQSTVYATHRENLHATQPKVQHYKLNPTLKTVKLMLMLKLMQMQKKNKTNTVPNPTTNPNPNPTIDEAGKRKGTE